MTHITVTPDDTPVVVVNQEEAVVVVQQEQAVLVTAVREGPQGPQGPPGPAGATALAALTDVDVTGKGNKSVLYYDAGAGKWTGDSLQTLQTISDFGNF